MINTKSAFYYGFNVVGGSNYFEFIEGAITYFFTISTRSYLPVELASEISKGLNETGSNDYSVIFNRTTLGFDISSSGVFSIPCVSGGYADSSIFHLIGYTSDKTGLISYSSDEMTGFVYKPQMKLQGYTPFEHFTKVAESTQRKTASGAVEVVNYGTERFMECSISYITKKKMDGLSYYTNSQTAVEDCLSFISYASSKLKLEFWPDENNPSNYFGCILDKTDADSSGTGFKLKEMYDKGLIEFYDIGKLVFREV